jgi:predicted nucleic acid-binding Zn ribbon protein
VVREGETVIPIREYICECGNKKERIEKVNCDLLPPKCELCMQEMKRIPISSGGTFILKGGGWASTGYSKKNK